MIIIEANPINDIAFQLLQIFLGTTYLNMTSRCAGSRWKQKTWVKIRGQGHHHIIFLTFHSTNLNFVPVNSLTGKNQPTYYCASSADGSKSSGLAPYIQYTAWPNKRSLTEPAKSLITLQKFINCVIYDNRTLTELAKSLITLQKFINCVIYDLMCAQHTSVWLCQVSGTTW